LKVGKHNTLPGDTAAGRSGSSIGGGPGLTLRALRKEGRKGAREGEGSEFNVTFSPFSPFPSFRGQVWPEGGGRKRGRGRKERKVVVS